MLSPGKKKSQYRFVRMQKSVSFIESDITSLFNNAHANGLYQRHLMSLLILNFQ